MYIKTLQSKGAHAVVEIQGEVLFAPGADIDRWRRRFTANTRASASKLAPGNSRPRWAHYGKPLKSTFMPRTAPPRITANGGFFYSAVGSSAPYSAYVDQGTGIYSLREGGGSPWKAKILPPYHEGSPSLYEHTWRPHPGAGRVADVMIKGQKPQQFMEAALMAAAAKMRLVMEPGGAFRTVKSMDTKWVLSDDAAFSGATPWSFAFDAQLREWRAWRQEEWGSRLPVLGEREALNRRITSLLQRKREKDAVRAKRRAEAPDVRRRKNRDRMREYRKNNPQKTKSNFANKTRRPPLTKARRADITAWVRDNLSRRGYSAVTEVHVDADGTWTASVKRSKTDDSYLRISGHW